jgi:hypothetical protein
MLTFSKIQTYLVIGGKTFYAKEAIKTLGGKWDPITGSWMLPVHLDSEMLRKDLQEKALAIEAETKTKEKQKRMAERTYALSSESVAAAAALQRQTILKCLEEKKKTGAFHWICCENCKVIDWRRMHTSCDTCVVDCGLYKNTFRVRGMIYTGD